MLRLFTGLELPSLVTEDLAMMQGGIMGAKWVDPESFHLTLRFIGDIEVGLGREVAFALNHMELKPFTICLKGIDVFGGKKPHAIIVHVEENAELRRLQQAQERLFQSLGLEAAPRNFTPHVTLARLKDPDPVALQRFIESHGLYRSMSMRMERFVLFSSRPSRGGGPYAVEEAYDMVGA